MYFSIGIMLGDMNIAKLNESLERNSLGNIYQLAEPSAAYSLPNVPVQATRQYLPQNWTTDYRRHYEIYANYRDKLRKKTNKSEQNRIILETNYINIISNVISISD